MKKDIFLSTKKKIIATSTIIVFGCLIVFAIITQVLYSSRVLDVIDHQLLEQKEIFTKEQFNPNYYEYIFNEDRHNLDGDLHKDEFKNPDGGENPHRPENFDGKLDSKPKHIPPNLIVIVYKNNEFETMSRNLYFSKDNLPTISNDAENEVVTIINNGYNFREIAISSGEYKIQVIANIDSEVNSINRLRYSIAVSLIILIIIAIILSAYLSTKVIRPVREAYEKQVYFVQDASHEMRTPLAVIKGKLELLAHSWGDTIDEHFEHISKMMSEVRG